eukprot:scaffold2107_cov222-Pinguiococcus_pyrenoidosus.AAC.12
MDPPHFDDEATAPLPEGKSDASQQEETKCGGEDSDEDGRLCWAAALRAAVEAAERDPILVPRPRRPSRVAATYAERPMVRAEAKRAGRRMRGSLAFQPTEAEKTNILEFLREYSLGKRPSEHERRSLSNPELSTLSTEFGAATAPRDPQVPKAFRILGVSSREELSRIKALHVMGVTEGDVEEAKYLFATARSGSPAAQQRMRDTYGQEGAAALMKFFGATEEQLLRRKALDILGLTEGDIEDERAARLSGTSSASPHK